MDNPHAQIPHDQTTGGQGLQSPARAEGQDAAPELGSGGTWASHSSPHPLPGMLAGPRDDGTQPFPAGEVEWAELRGPTDCSVYDRAKWEALLDRLGPDPLGEDPKGHDDPAKYVETVRKSKKPELSIFEIGMILLHRRWANLSHWTRHCRD